MIPVSKAIKIIDRETRTIGCEVVDLARTVGRVLGQNVASNADMPPFDRSQMDGFAVRAEDTTNAPIKLELVGESAAGHGWHRRLNRGEAVRIMTGAPVPKGADAVQRLELTGEPGAQNVGCVPSISSVSADTVLILEAVEKERFIVKKGAECKKGALLFQKGTLISERMIAGLAAFGYSVLTVSKQPSVAIISTGSEIVPIDKAPGNDQIRNSNSLMLKVLCEQAGASGKMLPIVPDDLLKLKDRISTASEGKTDILVITGGVSVGKYDLTKAALAELGAEIFFERVRLKPGKPAVFARLNGVLIFGLPGNPVSAAVTFYLFVRRAIRRLQGANETHLREGFAVLGKNAKAARERDTYLPATLETNKDGRLIATPLRALGSSDFIGFAKAEALIMLPKNTAFAANDIVRILYL